MSGYTIQVGDTEITATSHAMGVAVYNCVCNVVRMTKTNTALGATEVAVVRVTDMPCDIVWLGGKENIIFNKETHTLDAVLRCRQPTGIEIVNTDKIVYDGDYFEITNVKDVGNLGTLLEIAIKRAE